MLKTQKILLATILTSVTLLGVTGCSESKSTEEKPASNSEQTTKEIPVPEDVNDISTDVSTQTEDSYIVGPITGTIADIIKKGYVKIPGNSHLIISQLDASENSLWAATLSDATIATFIPGVNGDETNFGGTPPMFEALSIGKTDVTMTNSATGETVKFTIEVMPVR